MYIEELLCERTHNTQHVEVEVHFEVSSSYFLLSLKPLYFEVPEATSRHVTIKQKRAP